MFQRALEKAKHPVMALREKMASEPVKRGTIWGLFMLFVLVFLNIATIISAKMAMYAKKEHQTVCSEISENF